MPRVDCHFVKRSLNGPDDECGDTGYFRIDETQCLMAEVDVLGHGPEAYEVAVMVNAFLAESGNSTLVDILQGLHRHLRGTRGCVASLCHVDLATGVMRFSGVGNIVCRIFGIEHLRMVSRDGIVGYMMSQPQEQIVQLAPGNVVMLYSDGIKEHFEVHDLPGLLTGSAKDIADRVMKHFAKGDDDASCLVMRYVA
ncbi:serine phosphatase RsbU (regulator of sigma subunit) [Desulfobaculum xiamenense]|uniref:Serine phosphatase RsbU (Regulator of sigma subunit) n=1 Tax=Desulfobaculum xiamenense TaxID=995050 RepID=A0A846QR21_9BACT|nr:SpoIIE family protein phosphatase [Desulfobaculum xiamenense]NJB69430.1 serine phosphatase RsbU (regulator of sigma subunit) [Desulfobaculum xiamenense]